MLTLSQAAEEAGMSRRVFYDLVMSLHRKHGGKWLQRLPGGKVGQRGWRINMSLLAAAHPEYFEKHYITRDEAEELSERVEGFEIALDALSKRIAKNAVLTRKIEDTLRRLEDAIKVPAR